MYEATIEAYRSNKHKGLPMLLLTDVTAEGNVFRDHVWVKWSKRLSKFRFRDRIKFTAKQIEYLSSNGTNHGLSHLRNIKRIS